MHSRTRLRLVLVHCAHTVPIGQVRETKRLVQGDHAMLEKRRVGHWPISRALQRRDEMLFGLQRRDGAFAVGCHCLEPGEDFIGKPGMSRIDIQIEMAWKFYPAPGHHDIAVLPQGCAPILFLFGYRVPAPGEIAHMPPLLRRPGTLDGVLRSPGRSADPP